MFRLSGFFFIFIAVLCGVLLFQTSQSVQTLESELAVIVEKNQTEKDEIRVLSTEWDYLNSPQRLESLVWDQALQPMINYTSEAHKIPEPSIVMIPKRKPALIHYEGGQE